MKKSFFFVAIYIVTLLLFTAFVSAMILLYPGTPGYLSYTDPFERIADVFSYSFFSLLPLSGVVSLLFVVFAAARRGSSSLFDFLVYLFLCCVVWLLIIPLCFLYNPAPKVSAFITGRQEASPAALFFKNGFSYILLRDYEAEYLKPPALIGSFFPKLFFAASVIRSAVAGGRLSYLITASAGLAFGALYGFYSFSRWKLMNAALVIVFAIGIGALNIYIHTPAFSSTVHTKWFPLFINSAVCVLLCILPLTRAIVRLRAGTGSRTEG